MTALVFRPAAVADIERIWDYTADAWNPDQADRYVDEIREACEGLAAGRRTSRPADIRPGYRKAAVSAHMIYFRADGAGI